MNPVLRPHPDYPVEEKEVQCMICVQAEVSYIKKTTSKLV
jgi:hypothetical protein